MENDFRDGFKYDLVVARHGEAANGHPRFERFVQIVAGA